MRARTIHRLTWLTRTVAALALTVLLAAPTPGADLGGADPAALDARLGGTLATFVAAYGPPVAVNYAIGAVFTVPGYGLVAAQFGWELVPDDLDLPALLITLRSPRPDATPATHPHPADWSPAEGRARAARFLPADVTFGEPGTTDGITLVLPCQSAAPSTAFGAAIDHHCQAGFIMPTPETVSFVTLTLTRGTGDDAPSPAAACAGMAAWSHDAAVRMAAAAALLAEIEATQADDPDAATDLARIAVDFRTLAAAQRAAPAPPAATKANYFLIGALTAFADAAEAARQGLLTGDEAQIDLAVQKIEEANRGVTRATNAIAAVAAQCGLIPGTPSTEYRVLTPNP